MNAEPDLTGRNILLVEDDLVVARSLARLLKAWGAKIVGPAVTSEKALALVNAAGPLDFAMLDINLQEDKVFSVADALVARGVPFAFTTGYEVRIVPKRYRHAAVLHKPYDPPEILKVLLPRND